MIIVVTKNWVTIKGPPGRLRDEATAINVNDVTSVIYEELKYKTTCNDDSNRTIIKTHYDTFEFIGNYVEILVSCIEKAKELDSPRKTMEFHLNTYKDPLHPKPNRTEVNNFDECEPTKDDKECELPESLKAMLHIMKTMAVVKELKKNL